MCRHTTGYVLAFGVAVLVGCSSDDGSGSDGYLAESHTTDVTASGISNLSSSLSFWDICKDFSARISAGAHTCYLTTTGNVSCFGYDADGQTNDYIGGDAIGVAAGMYHTCILKSGGNVDCYGDNTYGQAEDYLGGDATGVAAGYNHTCILMSTGNVACYGLDSHGNTAEYGGQDAVGVAAGHYHTCVLKEDGNVTCYGENDFGQSEDYTGGDAVSVRAGKIYTCILRSDRNVDCYGTNGNGLSDDYVGGDAIGIAAGATHTCILKSDGNVACHGLDNYGETADYGGGDAVGVAAGALHTCILRSDGNVLCYGSNTTDTSDDPMKGNAQTVCQAPKLCTTDADCAEIDGDPCTVPVCSNLLCKEVFNPDCCLVLDDCIDENPCNIDLCFNASCIHLGGLSTNCCWAPDENPSGGPWTDYQKQAFADAQCDDGNACTGPDYCDLPNNHCHSGPMVGGCCNVNAECVDADPCTGDFCSNHVCVNNTVPGCCEEDSDCEDGDPCTLNKCLGMNCKFLFDSTLCCKDDAECKIEADDLNECTDEKCVVDPATGLRLCSNVLVTDCVVKLPYLQDFDSVTTYPDMGWAIVDYDAPAKSHWLMSTSGPMGPDRHIRFAWNPTTIGVRSVAVTPKIDASSSNEDMWNTQQMTTLQWRMSYTHSPQAPPVTLSVVASGTGDFQSGEVLWTATVSSDIEYGLFSVTIPDSLKFDSTLQIGFLVDADTTFSMDSWMIDDVVMAAGVSNELTRARWYRCLHESCSNALKELKVSGEGYIPDITMTANEHYQLELCYRDLDGTSNTWNYYGYPNAFSAGTPLDDPSFMKAVMTSTYSSCFTLETTAKAVCGDDSRYYCTFDLAPGGNQDAGLYRVGITTQDEFHPTKPHHSPFQSTYKATVKVLIDSGYIVWSPLGASHPSAVAIQAAISSHGKVAQIVPDLSIVEDLSPYDGVFAVLGVYGHRHLLTDVESQKLIAFLESGGGLYIEGGDFFFTEPTGQPETALHAYFQVEALADGATKLDGPVVGVDFMKGMDYDYDQGPLFNAFNDQLAHVQGSESREVLDNGSAEAFALAVAYDSGTYRTIGSSALFGGFTKQSGGKPVEGLMSKYLYFFENGWPACFGDDYCDDQDPCTTDICDPLDDDGDPCQHEPLDCNDNDICTVDSCDSGQDDPGCKYDTLPLDECMHCPTGQSWECVHPTICCYDGYCDTTVDPKGLCEWVKVTCDGGNACTVEVCDPVFCVWINVPIDCDDNDPCTIDGCNLMTGCTHVPLSCNDGNPCTDDLCDSETGQCTYEPKDCDDGNSCTIDSCDPLDDDGYPCKHEPNYDDCPPESQ